MVKNESVIEFGKLMTIHEKMINPSTLLFTEKTREWCNLPYPGHPKGCPVQCAAREKKASEYEKEFKENYDEFILVWSELDFKRYKELRKEHCKTWSDDQVKCVLYWQKSVKSILGEYVYAFYRRSHVLGSGSGFDNNPSMEGAGINVFGTLSRNKIKFEKKPVNKILTVFLVMRKTERSIF